MSVLRVLGRCVTVQACVPRVVHHNTSLPYCRVLDIAAGEGELCHLALAKHLLNLMHVGVHLLLLSPLGGATANARQGWGVGAHYDVCVG